MEAIRVPSLAENVNEATVREWLVAEGESIAIGQGVVELITEKAEFTLESEVQGTLTTCLAPAKSVMPVGSILCVLDASEDDVEAARVENRDLSRKHFSAPTVELDPTKAAELARSPRHGSDVRATPAARRLAKELGLDLEDVARRLGINVPLKEAHVRAHFERKNSC